jgi:hypothetical protein
MPVESSRSVSGHLNMRAFVGEINDIRFVPSRERSDNYLRSFFKAVRDKRGRLYESFNVLHRMRRGAVHFVKGDTQHVSLDFEAIHIFDDDSAHTIGLDPI